MFIVDFGDDDDDDENMILLDVFGEFCRRIIIIDIIFMKLLYVC